MNQNTNSQNVAQKDLGYFSQKRPEMLQYIPRGAKKILDVGCADGSFSVAVKKQNDAEVWGIELEPKVANEAEPKLHKMLVGDVNDLIDSLPDNYFDCIVFNDILEHLVDPNSLLDQIKKKLTQEGAVVASIPNVRYISTLVDLVIKKRWDYADSGILDRTHLRFFTQSSIRSMFESLGYDVIKLEGINPTKGWKFLLLNLLTLGFLSDAKYLEFACVAKPK